jgi:DNA polymerase-3 subunit alpha
MDFVHLKATSEYSITQSINLIPNMIKKVANNSMGALALTDLNGLYGAIGFYKKAKEKGIKPIIGIDLTIEQEDGNKYQLTLLAKNVKGYQKLIEINSKAYTENKKNDSVAAKEEWLVEIAEGNHVVVLSGGKKGLIGQYILSDRLDEAKSTAQQMKDFFGDDFYIELQRDGTAEEEKYMDGAVEITSSLQIAPVATHANYFSNPEDFLAHEARYCIGSKQTLFDIKREKIFNKDMYLKTKEEMTELFSDLPEAISNTVTIAKKCNIELSLGKPMLPEFPTPDNEPVDDYFFRIAREGLEERLIDDFPNVEERESQRAKYEDRLNWELETIKKMKFPGYFLIVSDFIIWAKKNDIPMGPGRGSGAGSLVAYAMKITDIDPLPYNLLFERFLNPDRVSMPDFDIDMCQSRREEVYEYVRDKYGVDAVCKIGTFGTMAAKAVVRDVGRTLGYPYDFVDNISKKINIRPNNPMTLKQFIFGDEDAKTVIMPDEKLLESYENEADVRKLIDIALKIEGITRQVGTHAAGVLISPTVLTDYVPLYMANSESSLTSQFNMKDVETAGLVKFDFLGLKNLTVIKDAVDLVNERKAKNNEEQFVLKKIDLKDPAVYKNVYASGNTIGIFQFESKGITSFLQKGNPTSFEDIIAMVSLYRPGPMEIIDDWIAAKSLPPEQRKYPDPRLKEVLAETYGYMVYQEQVMQCAQLIAGYSLGGADMLRRAMGKKDAVEMANQRATFIEGSVKNGITADKANHLFDLIDKFSGYGFNKSHAAAYSYLSYQTAYLKNYHAEEFFTANLNSNVGVLDTDKIALLLDDARKNKLTITAPDVNQSLYKFNIESDKHIRYGLGALKGVGEKAIHTIVQEREKNGPYTDFYNFLERVGRGPVNKRVMESLVKAGAFDSLHPNRAQLFDSIGPGLDYITKYRKKQMEDTPVLSDALFDDEPVAPKKTRKKKEVELIRPTLVDAEEWDELVQLKNEKTSLGYFFTSNPYTTYYTKQLDGFEAALKLAALKDHYNGNVNDNAQDGDEFFTERTHNTEAFVGGLVEEIKWWRSKKGAFVTISDGTSTVDVRMFADFLNDNKDWLKNDAFVALKVKIEQENNESDDGENLMLSVSQGFNFEQTRKLLTNKIFVGSENDPQLIEKFKTICEEFAGNSKAGDPSILLCLPNEQGRRKKKHSEYCVKAEPVLFEELVKTFGDNWVKASFKKENKDIIFPENPNKRAKKGVYGNYNNNQKRNAFST